MQTSVLLLLAVFPVMVLPQGELLEGETPEKAGWVNSGRVFPLTVSERPSPTSFPGSMTVFSPAKEIRAVLSLEDTLWIGTEGGLFAYDTVGDTVLSVAGPVFYSIRSITVDDTGTLWVGGDDGLSIRRNGVWVHYLRSENRFFGQIRDIVQGDGKMWIGTYGNGCSYIVDDSATVFSRGDSLLDDRVLSIFEETPEIVWFGTASGLSMSDTLHWESMRYGSRIPVGAVKDIVINEEGGLFLAVAMQGIVHYSLGRVRTFGEREGLPGREINSMSLDPNGRVWAAGAGGLSVFDGSGWTPYRPPGASLERYRFLSIGHDAEGDCYLGTDEGTVLIIARENIRAIYIPQGFPDPGVEKIDYHDGALWFLTNRSIYKLEGSMKEVEPPEKWCAGSMTDLFALSDDEIWITTRFGILHLRNHSWEVYDRRQGLPTEHFNFVTGAPGRVWFGTFDSGILALTGSGWIHFNEKNGLPDDLVTDLVVDGEGHPWIVVGGGTVARFAGEEWEEIAFPAGVGVTGETGGGGDTLSRLDPAIRFLTSRDSEDRDDFSADEIIIGLDANGKCLLARRDGIYRPTESGWLVLGMPETYVEPTAVLGTSSGEIWLGTAGNGVFIHRRGEWLNIDSTSGLAGNRVLSMTEDGNGRIWIGMHLHGIARFTGTP